jgi:hypothetical protein
MNLILNKFFIFLIVGFISPSKQEMNERINKTITNGNSKELSVYFHEKIELKVVNKENIYSKHQAEKIIEEFFRQFPPNQFIEIKNNSSKQAKQFVSGRYLSGKTKFRISYLLKKIDEQFYITQFRIERPHEEQFH